MPCCYKKILIYGTGYVARELIERLKKLDLIVVGVLDRFRISGEFMGTPILEWRDINEDAADAVFIAAPNKYCKEIYFRILPFCLAKGIEILDAGGNSLISYFGVGCMPKASNCYTTSEHEIKKLIEDNDIISFDVFDTLLVRDVVDPLDVFSYVEAQMIVMDTIYSGFRKNRRTAELNCDYGNIDEIYIEIARLMNLSDSQRDLLKSKEIESEVELLHARASIINILNYAKNNNKKIVAVSDMYLPKTILRGILEQKKITGIDEIFVSCDYGKSKTCGLFEEVVERYHTHSILHIGDDRAADIEAPREMGLQSIGIFKEIDLLKETPIGRAFGHISTIADSLWIGRVATALFDNPFKAYARGIEIDSIELFVEIYFVPLIKIYISKLHDAFCQKKYDGLLFVARDGYILQKCYERLVKQGIFEGPPSKYILCSRKMAIRVGLQNEIELRTILNFFDEGSLEATIKKIFDIEPQEGAKSNQAENIHLQFEKIMSAVRIRCNHYKSYLLDMGIDVNKKYLVCELDGHGTTVYYLNNIFDMGVDAIYLDRIHLHDLYDLECISIYEINDLDREYSSTYNNLVILENLFTSASPSVKEINIEGEFEYERENRKEEDIDLLKKIHSKALEEIEHQFKECKDKNLDDLSKKLVHIVFDTVSEVKLCGECKGISNWSLKDEMTGAVLDTRGI